jgi:hypothetical protein
VGGTGPQSGAGAGGPILGVLDDVLGGLLHANPFARTVG